METPRFNVKFDQSRFDDLCIRRGSENSILFLVEWKLGIEIENSRIVYEVNLDAMKREMEIMR